MGKILSFDTLLLLCFALAVVQFIVILLKTKKHQQFLDQFKAHSYTHAMKQLAQTHANDVWTIRVCYALFGVEVFVLTIVKHLFY